MNVIAFCYIDPVPSSTSVDMYYLIDGLNTIQLYAVTTYTIEPPCNTQGKYDLTLVSATGWFPAFMSFIDAFSATTSFLNNLPTAKIKIQSINYADKGLYSFTLLATSTQNPAFTDNTV